MTRKEWLMQRRKIQMAESEMRKNRKYTYHSPNIFYPVMEKPSRKMRKFSEFVDSGEENFGVEGDEFTHEEKLLYNLIDNTQKFSDMNSSNSVIGVYDSQKFKQFKYNNSNYHIQRDKQKYVNIEHNHVSTYRDEMFKRSEKTQQRQMELLNIDDRAMRENPD